MPKREPPVSPKPDEMYSTWAEGDHAGQALALRDAGLGMIDMQPVMSQAQGTDYFQNVLPNVSVPSGMNRQDYELMRPDARMPRSYRSRIASAMSVYDSIGIVRNVIDLMADFAAQGVALTHPDPAVEAFYKEWFRKVRGSERSERFLNLLFRIGNVVVRRRDAKLPPKKRKQLETAFGAPSPADMTIEKEAETKRGVIPWRYTFLNPLTLEIKNHALAPFLGEDSFLYTMEIPTEIRQLVQYPPKDKIEQDILKKLPYDLIVAARKGESRFRLDPNKICSAFYKRDDRDTWATPLVTPILPDLHLLQKMKLADLSALDGAISSIRLWKLGSLEHRIAPRRAAFTKLSQILMNNLGGGVMNLVWGADIELVETKTDVHKFLGDTKYKPVLNAIYSGFGISEGLAGGGSGAGGTGFTANFISLKTLTERLEYGRSILTAFWEHEVRIIQQAMEFESPARISFDRMVLTDEAAEKQLLINLADRDLISMQTLMERFSESPEVEQVRIKRELEQRKNGSMPSKASPFHDANVESSLTKLFVQLGIVAPSEVGVELKPKKPGEASPAETLESAKDAPTEKLKGQPGQGRPKQSNDKKKRKHRTVLPQQSATAELLKTVVWADNALGHISETASQAYLSALGKSNLRQLTNEQSASLENFKFALLCSFEPFDKITEESIVTKLSNPLELAPEVVQLYEETVSGYLEKEGVEPSMDMTRRFRSGIYAFWKCDVEEDE